MRPLFSHRLVLIIITVVFRRKKLNHPEISTISTEILLGLVLSTIFSEALGISQKRNCSTEAIL